MGLRTTAVFVLAVSLLQAQSYPPGNHGEQLNPAAAPPDPSRFVACPAGSPLGALELRVQSGDQRLPFRTINHLTEGDRLSYAPIVHGQEKRSGEVALVLVPEKRQPGEEDVLVTDPKPAGKPQEWRITRTISIAAVVYGPSGLNRKKIARFLSRDEALIAQLAEYADKTAHAEQLVATLSDRNSSAASINAALSGFASEYGFAVQINRSAPVSTQAATVFAAMNPQLAAYNPLASNTAQRTGQTASMAAMAGTLFFGSPIGLAAGGTAMLLGLRSIAFPDTQFRASLAQPLPASASSMTLCGQQGSAPPHTRVAYIWATRVPNIPAPPLKIGEAAYLPANQKTPLPVEVPEPGWKYLDRAREWALIDSHLKRTIIPVVKLGNQQALEIDLGKQHMEPGEYRLVGFWDWMPLEAVGKVHLVALSDFQKARLEPASQDRLLARSGKIPVTLTDSDFEFTAKVELKKVDDEFATPENVRFLLPKGLRHGPQERMDVQIDTRELDPGAYKLLISQGDDHEHAVNIKVLPNPPRIANLPILVNQGVPTQHFMLKGERLAQLSRLEAPGADFQLGPVAKEQTERGLTVELKSAPKPGVALPVSVYLADRSEPLTFADGLEVTGPLPVIASSKLSMPSEMPIEIRPGEFPAAHTLNAMLDVKNIRQRSILRIGCAEGVGSSVSLQIGEQAGTRSLQQLSPDQLFLALDTNGVPAGCTLQAVIDNGRDGTSQPFTLVRILRVPLVESLTLVEGPSDDGTRKYQFTGQSLETIEKVGWDDASGVAVAGLPTPLPGPGLKQTIQVQLRDPSASEAPLYIWLRGDQQGRTTTLKAPAPEPVEPAPPEASDEKPDPAPEQPPQ